MRLAGDSTWTVTVSGETPNEHDDTRARFTAVLNEVVDDLTRELGREPVFALSLIQVTAAGPLWRRLNTGTVMVSEELMRSRNVIAPLESVIRDLAR
jgi:hypothetical protein